MENVILIDAGNSRLKWATLKGRELSAQTAIFYDKQAPIECYAGVLEAQSEELNKVLLVSVQGDKFSEQAKKLTKDARLEYYQITSLAQLANLKNGYENPGQLGADRFVAIFAAFMRAKNKPCIVIDCGTAATIDAIDASGQHLGGLILPGLRVSADSLLKGTRQLRLDPGQNGNLDLLANNTSEAILSGSFYGLSGAIQETCLKIEKQITGQIKSKHAVKILCGGDAEALLPQLPPDFKLCADLVMQGLKLIAEHYLHYWDKKSEK